MVKTNDHKLFKKKLTRIGDFFSEQSNGTQKFSIANISNKHSLLLIRKKTNNERNWSFLREVISIFIKVLILQAVHGILDKTNSSSTGQVKMKLTEIYD